MFNLMLDRLPDHYKGYLIRTDYRIGIQISMALQDPELSDQEKVAVALTLLFGAGIPKDEMIARDGLAWYLRGGEERAECEASDDSQRSFDFGVDHARLWSGFRRIYGIDLGTAKMHWFQFLALLADLGGCAFSDVVGYRLADTSKMQPDMRRAYQKMQKRFAIEEPYSAEEQAAADDFMRQLRGCKNT